MMSPDQQFAYANLNLDSIATCWAAPGSACQSRPCFPSHWILSSRVTNPTSRPNPICKSGPSCFQSKGGHFASATMTAFTSHVVKVHDLCSPLLMPTTRSKYTVSSGLTSVAWSQPHGGRLRLEQPWPNRQLEKAVECAKGGSASASASEWGDEIVTEEELMGLGKLGGKCEETRGIAELLECLEREAIMGEDEGKEPTDYNRRAQIFHKSSRVFQSLKESSTPLP